MWVKVGLTKMNKTELLKIIQEECCKLEEKYSIPMDIQWDDIFDDEDEEINKMFYGE